ncbi:pyrroline-5-carboxylate reductase family protein [Ponticoccus alexandrii]|uniref:Pyrroline-5-carboxylate reductase n=1 Tax=Ponticoccus alexandrii TaxID=1943633 RepID=A0ABX7FFV9_9RHOB|nr:pyrroline-5-carboxylate reductase dimerization domain-containing protein [Ponticoccus alexandrii]ETA49391.2 hypothetical protein P279_24710 [Rhodobacteraceae bacterium PD-2]QRF69349.1 pyrroline-5-carboxylate reductase [Ponticoccus alexandrii]
MAKDYAMDIRICGGGAMGAALYDGLTRRKGRVHAVVLEDVDPARGRGSIPARTCGEEKPRLHIYALKPDILTEVMQAQAHLFEPGDTVLSVAAGIPLCSLLAAVPAQVSVIRAMPNMPVAYGAGILAYSHAPAPEGGQTVYLARAIEALSDLGTLVELDERQMDGLTALAGSGPAYVYAVVEALALAGQTVGLPPDIAASLARQVVIGSGVTLAHDKASASDLRQRITSPNGTTAAGLKVLKEDDTLSDLFVRCLAAAAARSRDLGAAKT